MLLLGGLGCAALAACARGNVGPGPSARAPSAAPPRPVAVAAYGDGHEGSAVALARLGGRKVALVADEDDRSLHTVDPDSLEELAVTPLVGAPGQVLARGGRVWVTLRDKNVVQVLDSDGDASAPLRAREALATAAEPVALATTPDDAHLLVTSGWGHALGVFEVATLRPERAIDLPREPRAVATSDDGTKAYVTHVVGGRVTVVDLVGAAPPKTVWTHEMKDRADDAPREATKVAMSSTMGKRGKPAFPIPSSSATPRLGCQGFALAKSVDPGGRVLAPQTLVETGDTTVRTSGYGAGSVAAEIGGVAVIDAGTDEVVPASVRPSRAPRASARLDCVLPRAAAVVAETGALLVACLGEDAVVEYDALAAAPHATDRRRWSVGAGPVGLAVDGPARRALVWSQFDRTLAAIDLAHAAPGRADDGAATGKARPAVMPDSAVVRAALSRKPGRPASVDLALGRRLFHAAGDSRIASDGRACASCHPDGRDDALTWATPDGPRQTPMLAGRLEGTAPYGWLGNGETVQAHLQQTFQRLRGAGLRGSELDALVGYVAALGAPTRTEGAATLAARGKEVFFSAAAECASCHVGAAGSDGAQHAVAPKGQADSHDAFDTPSLRFVGGTAPYFHDGRYATLRDVLVAPDHSMGQTRDLPVADLDALEAYLRTL